MGRHKLNIVFMTDEEVMKYLIEVNNENKRGFQRISKQYIYKNRVKSYKPIIP